MKNLPKVFISEPINAKGMELLKDKVQLIMAPDTSKRTALELIEDADAAILRAATIFDKDVIGKGAKLRVIARTGVGVDNVDLKFAAARGIFVCNTPGTNDETVAEHVLAVILAFAKQIIFMDKAVRKQHWKERFSLKQMDVKNKKLGIIGYGHIGKATAHFCKGIGMQVLAYDPFVTKAGLDVMFADDLETIFREADFISLHCPSTPLTHRFINRKYLTLMKTTAYLINASRGDLIDEEDLIKALEEKRLAGVALDVFKDEPLTSISPLLKFTNVLLSPHVAGSTKESNERIAVAAAQAVIDTLCGKIPDNICNLDYFPPYLKKPFSHDR